ncbi:rRNA-processing protein FCF1 homolog [Durusdinium trenchii]|uniref:rRNA-processing protein FCF1 homolog n=1 Tax=Durusdinium trenchii TaxID=1381693 RepID=A0ABP0K8G7_9DINO
MGTKQRKAQRKRQVGLHAKRLSEHDSRTKAAAKAKATIKKKKKDDQVKEAPKAHSSLFFQFNSNLKPPYQLLLDTNFINMSIQMKLDIFKSAMECLLAKCVPCITDCVYGELEKLGTRHRLALRLAKDPRFQRLTCQHKGIYADDCIHSRVEAHRCYIVCTNDKDLKRRIRKVPGVPIMSVARGMFKVERVPEQIDKVPIKSNWGKDK